MYVLGIESTAHTFGVGIVQDGKIITSQRDTLRPESGGIIPREAANHHYKLAYSIINAALDEAGLRLSDIDSFAFSQGPGILSPLKVGYQVASFLGKKFGKRVIGVNHCIAHLEIARLLTGFDDPLMLYVSGGNTQVITFQEGRYRVFGETQDIGLGNLIDKVGRELGIPFPAGPKIEQYASIGKKYINMPYSIKGMDVSFSGLATFISKIIGKEKAEDICYSLQETVFSMVIEASERAMAYCGKDTMVITGGVAANSRLNQMGEKMCGQRGAKFRRIPMQYAGDNGAMIAYAGYLMPKTSEVSLMPKPIFRTDSVEIEYR